MAGGPVPPAAARVFGSRLPDARAYAELLATDGIDHGLIGPREADRLWSRHLLPSAVPAVLLPRAARVADIGSGAGLPGLVLALARPDLTVVLVEPMARRCAFLERAVELTRTGDRVEVRRARAEELVGEHPDYDVVVARAVARLPRLVELLLPLCRSGGQVLAIKGAGLDDELAEAAGALAGPRVRRWDAVRLDVPVGSGEAGPGRAGVSDTADGPTSPVDADVVRLVRVVAADSVPLVHRGRGRGRRGPRRTGTAPTNHPAGKDDQR